MSNLPVYTLSLLDAKFIAALACLVGVRLVAPRVPGIWLGALASIVIVGLASPPTLVLLAGIALLILYPLARLMQALRDRGEPTARTRPLLMLGIGALVVIWLLFKFNKSFALPWFAGTAASNQLLAVIGFSYFLFRAINYLFMHHLVAIPERGPLLPVYYLLFPPTLTSGPIQKYLDFKREAMSPRPLTLDLAIQALRRITTGYFFKVCLAAWCSRLSDTLLEPAVLDAYHSAGALALMYLFFFFDFAGYSHIAIGFGLLLGIRVPENFRNPFLATSVTEFWRHWHITLADWFRDHVFIPLGGMRLGGLRASLLAAGIMVGCGFWHGITLPFMAWGLWHGGNLFVEGVLGVRPLPPGERRGLRFVLRALSTNARVAIGAAFFLPDFNQILNLFGGFLRW